MSNLWKTAVEQVEPERLYHGTVAPGLTEIRPASQHGGDSTFRWETDRDYAYATHKPEDAWHWAEQSWHSPPDNVGIGHHPKVYEVEPTGPHEKDPLYDQHGNSRSNFDGDVRSRHPFKVIRELPMPENMGKPEDWHE